MDKSESLKTPQELSLCGSPRILCFVSRTISCHIEDSRVFPSNFQQGDRGKELVKYVKHSEATSREIILSEPYLMEFYQSLTQKKGNTPSLLALAKGL